MMIPQSNLLIEFFSQISLEFWPHALDFPIHLVSAQFVPVFSEEDHWFPYLVQIEGPLGHELVKSEIGVPCSEPWAAADFFQPFF